MGSPSPLGTGGAHPKWRLNDTRPAAGRTRGQSSEFTSLDRDEEGGGGYDADPASSWTGSSLPSNLHAPNTGNMARISGHASARARVRGAARHVVERRDESLGQVDVWSTQLRVERIRRHEQRPGEALGGLLVVVGAPSLARVDGVAVEAQRGDEAALGMVGLEDLDVRGVVDALGSQCGDAVAVNDESQFPLGPAARHSPR